MIKLKLINKQLKIFKLFLIIILNFIYIIFNDFYIKINDSNTKVCLCTVGKVENRYIKEFVQFYEKIGIDKIFLYDNNDLNGERFEEIINDYVNKGFVNIINFRGLNKVLLKYMNDCYKNNYKNFNWIVFYEIDEYIHLKNYKNIKNYLNNPKFNNCETINLNWVFHTDNNLIYYDNRSLFKRFPKIAPIIKNKRTYNMVKSILKGNISNIYIYNTHFYLKNLKHATGLERDIKYIIKECQKMILNIIILIISIANLLKNMFKK